MKKDLKMIRIVLMLQCGEKEQEKWWSWEREEVAVAG